MPACRCSVPSIDRNGCNISEVGSSMTYKGEKAIMPSRSGPKRLLPRQLGGCVLPPLGMQRRMRSLLARPS
jgi:hypothetical protein